MKVLRVLVLAALALLVLASSEVSAKRKCRRVRKPWEAMSQQEKDTYVKAVGIAMEKGYFALFTKVHANRMSSDQAHNTCGFLLWHRRLLLAYENMLRSFGPEFSCVTIPVWNVFGAFAMQTQKKCRSIEECSPLLQALGGSKGIDATLQIESRKFGPNCVNKGPVGKYCDGPGMDPAMCTKCIPRGNWASTALPDSLSYSNLIGMLSEVKGAKDLNQNVQHSSHDHVHSALKGVMSSFYSPLDPVFYSLHTTVDMLHHLYYTCNIDGYLSKDDKISLPKAWQSCSVNGGPQVDATSDIVMKYFVGEKEVSVLVDDHLKPFYQGVPNKFFELVDAADIGANSYSYRMTTLLTDLMSNTANAFQCSPQATRRLRESGVVFSSINATDESEQGTVAPPSEATTVPVKNPGSAAGLVPADAVTVGTAQGQSEQTSTAFYYQALELAKARAEDDKEAREMVELMECKIFNETVAPVEDFTPEFRFEFNIPPNKYPRCYELLVVKKKVVIDVPEWRPLAEEQLHVELAKPVDPTVDVSELDSPHAAEIEVEIVEPLVTPAPDTPVATAAPVKKEDIAISAENAQTPPPTTPAPPTTEPEATSPPSEDTDLSTAASGVDDDKPLDENSSNEAEVDSSGEGSAVVDRDSEPDGDGIGSSKEETSDALGAGSGNGLDGEDAPSPQPAESVDAESSGSTGGAHDDEPRTPLPQTEVLSSEGSGAEAVDAGSDLDELVNDGSAASSASDISENFDPKETTDAGGSGDSSAEDGEPDSLDPEDGTASVANGTDSKTTTLELDPSIAPVSVNFSSLDPDSTETSTSSGSSSGTENADDLTAASDAFDGDGSGSSSLGMDDDKSLAVNSSSMNDATIPSLTPSMTPVSANFSDLASGSSSLLADDGDAVHDSSGSAETGEDGSSTDASTNSSGDNGGVGPIIPDAEANGTSKTQPGSNVFVFNKKFMRSANETVATVDTGALPGDDEDPVDGESAVDSSTSTDGIEDTAGDGTVDGSDDNTPVDLRASSSSTFDDTQDVDVGSTDQDSTPSEVEGVQPATDGLTDAASSSSGSVQAAGEGDAEQDAASSRIDDEASMGGIQGTTDGLDASSSSSPEEVEAIGDDPSAGGELSEADDEQASANPLGNSSNSSSGAFDADSTSSSSDKINTTIEAPVPGSEDFSDLDDQTNSTATVHAAEMDDQPSDSNATGGSQAAVALYDAEGSDETTQADAGGDADTEDDGSNSDTTTSELDGSETASQVSDLLDDAASTSAGGDTDELVASSSDAAFLPGVETPEEFAQEEADDTEAVDAVAPTRPPTRSLLQRLKDTLVDW